MELGSFESIPVMGNSFQAMMTPRPQLTSRNKYIPKLYKHAVINTNAMIFRSSSAPAAESLRVFLLPRPIRSHILLLNASRCSSSSSSSSSYSLQHNRLASNFTPNPKRGGKNNGSSRGPPDMEPGTFNRLREAFALSNISSISSTTNAVVKGDKINASSTTLPAPLDIPSRGKDQSTFKYALQAGKLYISFYKTGIKNIWHNYKQAKELKHRLNSTQTPQLPPGPDAKTQKNVYAKYVLTRAELQFLRRSQHDMNRVPIFALLFAIVGEWLPLIVIFFTPIVPYTCRIPRQIEKSRRALEETRRKSFRGEIDGYIPTMKLRSRGGGETVRGLEDLEKGQLMHISRSLGLHSRLWDYTKGFAPGSGILKWRVKRHLEYLEKDDVLLVRDGGIKNLNKEEVLLACEQRGIDILGRKEEYLKDVLERWIKGRREGMVLGMLLSR
jgi:hypothetical protein